MPIFTKLDKESLWGLGYSPEQINRIKEGKNYTNPELQAMGIRPDDVITSRKMAEWRADDKKSFRENAERYLKEVLGWDNTKAVMKGGNEDAILAAAKSLMGPQAFTQFAIKTRIATSKLHTPLFADVPKWNPLRGDAPKNLPPPPTTGAVPSTPNPQTRAAPAPAPRRGAPAAATRPQEGIVPRARTTDTSGFPADGGPGANNAPRDIPPPPPPSDPAAQDAWIRANFGYQAWFLDIPEVRNALRELAGRGVTDPEEAKRAVSGTQWFKTTATKARSWFAYEREDPASAAKDVEDQFDFVNHTAARLGITLDPDRARAIAEQALRYGWAPNELNKAIAADFEYDPKNRQQSAFVSGMKKKASAYLVPLSDSTIESWAKNLIGGNATEEQFDEYLKGMAKSMNPALVSAIDAGITVEEYLNPYKEMAARVLDRPPESIDFMDPKYRKALEMVDPKTGTKSVMTLSDWETNLKKDPVYGWDKTQGAYMEALKLRQGLARQFGMAQ